MMRHDHEAGQTETQRNAENKDKDGNHEIALPPIGKAICDVCKPREYGNRRCHLERNYYFRLRL